MNSSKIKEIIDSQNNFYCSGQTREVNFRIKMLTKLKESILNNESLILDALYKDLGKSPTESYMTEVGMVLKEISFALKNIKKWTKDKLVMPSILTFFSKDIVRREPYGTVLIISPFNYPFYLSFIPMVAAIAGGNTIVLKVSRFTNNTSEVINKILKEAFDPSYIKCIYGENVSGQELTKQAFDYIFFTGSSQVGRDVMKAASEKLIPVTLELGGKSPVFVDKSSKLKETAESIIWGKLTNAGETCIAPDYLLVDKMVSADLIKELELAIERMYGKDIINNPDYSRIINEKHVERIAKILEKDKEFIIYGGKIDREKRFVSPTLLKLNDYNAASMEEELFAPLLPIIEYDNISDAISYVVNNWKPLALYVFSEDKNYINKIIKNVDSGGVTINDTMTHIVSPRLPFGGVGMSGMGYSGGKNGFETFTRKRAISYRKLNFTKSIQYPPFKKNTLSLLKRLMK